MKANPRELLMTEEPERTRLLVLVSAWWTLTEMENTGTTFSEFIEAATSDEPGGATRLWSELTTRLHAITTDALGKWPESVLAPEVRQFIEALVVTMGQPPAKSPSGESTE